MTFNIGHVEGGTNAGWKREKQAHKEPWKCSCGTEQSPTYLNCPDCRDRRPKE